MSGVEVYRVEVINPIRHLIGNRPSTSDGNGPAFCSRFQHERISPIVFIKIGSAKAVLIVEEGLTFGSGGRSESLGSLSRLFGWSFEEEGGWLAEDDGRDVRGLLFWLDASSPQRRDFSAGFGKRGAEAECEVTRYLFLSFRFGHTEPDVFLYVLHDCFFMNLLNRRPFGFRTGFWFLLFRS